MRTAFLLAAALALAAAPTAAAAPAGSKTITSGAVTATLSWQAGMSGDEGVDAEAPRLRIEREGTATLDADLTRECRLCTSLYEPGEALSLRDLDGDGEPEVLVDLFSGGAHCCATTLIWFRQHEGWLRKVGSWGNGGVRLRDLDRDGRPELLTIDDRFAYEFTAYAFSWRPPQILRFRAGKLQDVTRRFPAEVRKDMRAILRALPSARKGGDPRGLVAAYAADLCLLGRPAEMRRYLDRAVKRGDAGDVAPGGTWPAARRFKSSVVKFLRANGYCT